MPDLSTLEGQAAIEEHVEKADLIVADNISTLCRTGEENAAEGWVQAQNWALSLRARGKSVIWVHHTAKNGSARGTSKREDVLDTIIYLERPPGVGAEEGARFIVNFTKNRGFIGEDAKSFEVKLVMDRSGTHWHIVQSEQDKLLDQVAHLINSGEVKSLRGIGEKLNISKNRVSSLKNQCQKLGKIK